MLMDPDRPLGTVSNLTKGVAACPHYVYLLTNYSPSLFLSVTTANARSIRIVAPS